jgi:hypothetical protein
LKAAQEHRQQADKLHWEGVFADYLELVRQTRALPIYRTPAFTT